MKSLLQLLALLVLVSGCSEHKSRSLPVEEFNEKTAEVHKSGSEDWPLSCLQVALRFAGDREEARSRRIEISSMPERFETTEIVILEEGLMDDSLDGYRHRLNMKKTREGFWRVEAAEQSWKCQSGRGHRGYSCEPCH